MKFSNQKKLDITKNSCLAKGCHLDLVKVKYVHATTIEDCSCCHTLVGTDHPAKPGNEYILASNITGLCENCHKSKEEAEHIHVPYEGKNCLACHAAHSSNQNHLMKLVNGKSVCISCHDVIGHDTIIHGPVVQGDCTACHLGHSSDIDKLLIVEGKKLCLTCHSKTIKTKDKEILNIAEKMKKIFIHPPAKTRCNGCHLAHKSKNNALLKDKFIRTNYVNTVLESFYLCIKCHQDEFITEEFTSLFTNFRNGTKNLHYLHITKKKGRNCNLCHDVHGSNNKRLINDQAKYGDWSFNLNFVKESNGGSCTPACHKKLSYSQDSIATSEPPRKDTVSLQKK